MKWDKEQSQKLIERTVLKQKDRLQHVWRMWEEREVMEKIQWKILSVAWTFRDRDSKRGRFELYCEMDDSKQMPRKVQVKKMTQDIKLL